jgi:glycosyltransferase involved in cell wall biosynthesis
VSVPRISVITSFLNEVDNLPAWKQRVEAAFAESGETYELVFVDDHSSDGSTVLVRNWSADDSLIQYIRLSRNCGSHAAFSAGLETCRGDCAILLAADLQDPPETIPRLLHEWQQGYNVVWAARSERLGESWSTKLFSSAYYRIMQRLALPDMPRQGADFVLLDRKVIDAYNAIPEKNTSFLAMILWLGFRQTTIAYVKEARAAGKSKWTFARKIKLLVDSIVSFSFAPIRFASYLGMLVSLSAFAFSIDVFVNALFGKPIEGYSSLMMIVLWLGGIQLLILGILGEYLWRAFDQVRGRPYYIVEERSGGSVSAIMPTQLGQTDSAMSQQLAE